MFIFKIIYFHFIWKAKTGKKDLPNADSLHNCPYNQGSVRLMVEARTQFVSSKSIGRYPSALAIMCITWFLPGCSLAGRWIKSKARTQTKHSDTDYRHPQRQLACWTKCLSFKNAKLKLTGFLLKWKIDRILSKMKNWKL